MELPDIDKVKLMQPNSGIRTLGTAGALQVKAPTLWSGTTSRFLQDTESEDQLCVQQKKKQRDEAIPFCA